MFMFMPSWLRNRKRGSGLTRTRSARLSVDELEPRNLLAALATADVFTRFQDTVNDPAAVTNLILAESQASVGPDLGRTVGHARAETAGAVRSLSQAGGIDGGPSPMDPSARAEALAVQTGDYIVHGLPAGTAVALDATLMLRGFLDSRNFASLSANLFSFVQAELTVTSAAGAQVVEGRGLLSGGMLTTAGLLNLADFTLGPGSTIRTPHYDLDLTRTLPGAFTVTAGEVFTVEATLWTVGSVAGPFELFTTADFFTDTRGFSFTLAAPGATVLPSNDADLAVTLLADADPVGQGDLLTYTIDVTNLGPNEATSVTLIQELPQEFQFESSSEPAEQAGDVLTFHLGNLAVGAQRTVTVSGRPGHFGTNATTVSVSGSEADLETGNNRAVLETQVEPALADVAISMSAWSGSVFVGEIPVSYTTTVTNRGPSLATGVILEQRLPPKIDFVSAPGGAQPVNGLLTFHLGELAPGESRDFQVTVIPRTNGTFVSSASVTALQIDLLPRNNEASASGEASGAGLRPEISASALTVPIGEPVTITFALVNRDENDATAASMDIRLNVIDYLDPIYVDAAETSQGTLTLATAGIGRYHLDAGPIASGDMVVVTFRLRGYDLFTLEPVHASADDPVLGGFASNTISVTFVPNPADIDSDFVLDAVEDGAPNNGDGNNDGVPDSQQNHITSLPNVVDGRYVTLETGGDTDPGFDHHLLGVEAIPVPPNPPAGAAFPIGLFRFQVYTTGFGNGTVYIWIPDDVFPTSYWKYGPTPEDITPHWYVAQPLWVADIYPDVQLPVPGQRFHRIELFLWDGRRGDSDLVSNGRVTDPGGPALRVLLPPPTAQSIVNDGHAQRSMINSLTVTFSGVVTFDPGAFELRNAAGRAVGLNLSASVVNGGTVVLVTFQGPGVIGGSLADGTYRLLLHSDRIHDQFGQALDGDHDGAAGGDAITEFFRRFGDTDGDGDVDKDDRRAFKAAWRSCLGDADYRWYLDHDLDGDIDRSDKKRFQAAYQSPRCRR